MRRLLLIPLLAALACRGGDTSSDRRTLVDSRDNYDPRSLDPALSTDVPTGRAVAYLFDGLTQFTPDAKVRPALAEQWDVSKDGLTYTFHLRHGVTFHDGSPFTARDVEHSFTRALDPATHGGRAEPLRPIHGAADFAAGKAKSIAGLSVKDEYTITITLDEPLATFPKLLAMPVASIVPAATPANFGERPVGTGPWKLAEWKHDDYLLFARNDAYWGGHPAADSLRARIIAEPSTAVAEFESGSVDVLQIPPGETSTWTEDENRKPLLASVPALQLVYIAINTTRGPLQDVRVRQAINYAIDGNAILKALVSGRGRRAAGVIPPTLAGADTARAPYPYDTTKARALMAAAGHASGIDIELWTSSNPIYVRIAETVQGYLGAVGIRAKIVQRESAASREAARKGQTDMLIKDWYADYPDAENFLYPLLHSANKGVGGNVSFFQDAGFDRIVSTARREQDEGKRTAMYRQADSVAFAQAPMVFLYFYDDLYAVQKWVKGFQPPVIFNGQRWTSVSIARAKP